MAECTAVNFHAAESKRFKVKIGVFLVLLKDDSLLCLRRHQTGIEDGLYVVPMGGLQEGETPLQAVVREALEEVNLIIKDKDLILRHVMYRKHTQPDGYFFYQQDLFFVTDQFTGILRNLEPHKADDVRFFTLKDLPKTLSPFIGQAIKCILADVPYSEFGFSENER
ncbi:MAG: NUDIX domain-containing protein [Proteobacteria bacterium]|nr:NUDIX domain-containing protein [Pseudomonadota bacterium]